MLFPEDNGGDYQHDRQRELDDHQHTAQEGTFNQCFRGLVSLALPSREKKKLTPQYRGRLVSRKQKCGIAAGHQAGEQSDAQQLHDNVPGVLQGQPDTEDVVDRLAGIAVYEKKKEKEEKTDDED